MSLYAQHRCGGDTQRGVQLTVAMPGVGVVLGVDTAGALPTGAGGGKARGMHEVKRATEITCERRKISGLVNSNSRRHACADFPRRFFSREMLVKRQILFLLIA